jgi:hypothetical protein
MTKIGKVTKLGLKGKERRIPLCHDPPFTASTAGLASKFLWYLKAFVMRPLTALGGGLAGAVAVTLFNESVKRLVPQAPRMDLLGMNAVSRGLNAAGAPESNRQQLFTLALAGDLISNALYYSAAGIGKEKNLWVRSSLLGLAAGIGAVILPGPLGLEEKHTNKSLATKLMTVGLYVAGSVVTAAFIKLISTKVDKSKEKKNHEWETKLVTSAIG